MSLLNVQGALQEAVMLALQDVPVNPDAYLDGSIPVELENVQFTPPEKAKWAQLFFLPNPPSVDTLGDEGRDYVSGIVQLTLRYPRNTGDLELRTDSEIVRAAFPAGRSLSQEGQFVTVDNCGRTAGRLVENWFSVYISIQWHAWIER